MFAEEEQANVTMTWILRLVGLIVMAAGIFLVLNPLATVFDIIPFLGGLASTAIALFAILVSLALSLITIAIGWVAYRPLIGIPLLVVGLAVLGGTGYLLARARGKKKALAQPT